MSKQIKTGLIVLLVLGGVGALALPKLAADEEESEKLSSSQPQDNRLPVTAHIARPGLVKDKIKTTGTILPNESVDLRSEVPGKVTRIAFKEGRVVKKGQLLLKVNDAELQAQRKRVGYRIELLEQKNLEAARENVEIALEQFELGTITSVELREVQEALLAAEGGLIQAKFQAKRAETALRRMAGQLSNE